MTRPVPVTLVLPLPPTMNAYWRRAGHRMHLSHDGRAFKEHCSLVAIAHRVKPLMGEVLVRGTVYMARKGCDLDNRIKPLLDALEGVVFENDGQVARLDLTRSLDRANPRCEVTVEPLEAA